MEQTGKKYRRKPEITLRSVAGAHLLLPQDGSDLSVYTLNGTGLQLWELISQRVCVKKVTRFFYLLDVPFILLYYL